jgi:hypothetical protein
MFKKSAKRVALIVVPVMLFLLFVGYAQTVEAAKPAPGKRVEVAFGGSSPGGGYFYMVGTMAQLLQKELPSVNMTNVATGASQENVQRLIKGELDFGLAHASHVGMGWNNEGDRFKGLKGAKDIRGIAYVYPSSHYFVVLKKSGIKTMADLKGKRVAMGQPGSGAQFNSELLLKILDIPVKADYMQFADAGRAIKEGRIDAIGQSGGPVGAIKELAETNEILLIPFSDAEMDKINKTVSYFYTGNLPVNFYKGMDKPVQLPFYPAMWIGHKNLADQVVYDILKTVYKPANLKALGETNREWRTMQAGLDLFKNLGIPMHAGAEKFYKEMAKEYGIKLNSTDK